MEPNPVDPEVAERKAILQHLVETGSLEGPAAGIARQVLARGEGSLSERQEYVFGTRVRTKYLDRVCDLCEQMIPTAEVQASWGNGGYCANCARILGKESGPVGTAESLR